MTDFKNIKKGDILVDQDGDESLVLGRLEDIVFLSRTNSFNRVRNYPYSLYELEDLGYILKIEK